MKVRDGATPPAQDEISKRRIRNRLSQRHFRERKLNYIKELEERVQATALTESERNKALVEEITELRSAVLKLRSQVSSIANELETVGADIGRILQVADGKKKVYKGQDGAVSARHRSTSNGEVAPPVEKVTVEATTEQQLPDSHMNEMSPNALPSTNSTLLHEHSSHGNTIQVIRHESPLPGQDDNAIDYFPSIFGEDANRLGNSDHVGLVHTEFNCEDYHEMPQQGSNLDISMHYWKTGFDQLTVSPTSIVAQTNLSLPPGHYPPHIDNTRTSHFTKLSVFSQHIELLELQARRRLDLAPDKHARETIYKCCSTVISAFVNNAWPQTWSIWFKSQVPNIIGPILSWRINPSIESFNGLLPDYKPTQTQLREPHSAVIDWVPYAPLRDRVIMFYNASAELDRLLCDMLNSYVIEVNDASRVLPSCAPGRAYFGVWNMFGALNACAPSQQNAADINATGGGFMSVNMAELFDSVDRCQPVFFPDAPGYVGSETASVPLELTEVLHSSKAIADFSHNIQLHQATTWRLDPAFFDKWSELKFDGYEKIVAKGRSYRFASEAPRAPLQMTTPIVQAYQDAISTLI